MSAQRLVLGTAQLALPYGIANCVGPPTRAAAVEIVRSAAAAGVRAVDTAPAYGDAEAIIGEAEAGVQVFTKLASGADVDDSIRRSLARLRIETIDVLFFHDPAVVSDDPGGVIGRAAEWLGRGVAALGASVYEPREFEAALADRRIAAVQAPVNLADGRMLDHLHVAEAKGMSVYARSVFLQGALLMPAERLPVHLAGLRPLLTSLDRICERRNLQRRDALVWFVRDLPGVSGVILGCETAQQLHDNLASLEGGGLTADDLDELLDLRPWTDDVLDPRRWETA